jgi:hypothetical protein
MACMGGDVTACAGVWPDPDAGSECSPIANLGEPVAGDLGRVSIKGFV